MQFIPNAPSFAANVMDQIDPNLTWGFENLIRCISINTAIAPASRSRNIQGGSQEYITKLANNFTSSRFVRAPTPPSTIPDEMVSTILNVYFNVPQEKLEEAKYLHALSMGAENIVGDLLERYIASVIEPQGWIWCSGSTVKSVDFIRPSVNVNGAWDLLQVKNRDNSENSSSSAIRNGTEIIKWFRTFSRTGETNWPAFPCVNARNSLSEAGFISFVSQYLSSMR